MDIIVEIVLDVLHLVLVPENGVGNFLGLFEHFVFHREALDSLDPDFGHHFLDVSVDRVGVEIVLLLASSPAGNICGRVGARRQLAILRSRKQFG